MNQIFVDDDATHTRLLREHARIHARIHDLCDRSNRLCSLHEPPFNEIKRILDEIRALRVQGQSALRALEEDHKKWTSSQDMRWRFIFANLLRDIADELENLRHVR